MEHQAKKVISTFFTAVQQGDMQQVGALVHPDIEWSQPGNNRFSGLKQSAAEVFQMVGGMFAATDNTLTLTEVKVISENGNSVACLIRWKAGEMLDVENIDVYTVMDGKITKAVIYSADTEQEDRFWGK